MSFHSRGDETIEVNFSHKPVLLEESIEYLNIRPDGVYLDGTIGGAGHSSEIYRRLSSKGILIGVDVDLNALEASRERLQRTDGQAKIIFENSNFSCIDDICRKYEIDSVDGIILDLGVSSHQLDEADRGFSYKYDAVLDMRMDKTLEINAEVIVNEYEEHEIRDIISRYGEERWASRIAAFIIRFRKKRRIRTTWELVDIIKAAIPSSARRSGPHPAKRTFQALRIAVNKELEVLGTTVNDGINLLKQDGRLCIITFHSLEDRIVKDKFKKNARRCTCPPEFPVCICERKPLVEILTAKPVVAGDEELEGNPRARSAKLRVVRKI